MLLFSPYLIELVISAMIIMQSINWYEKLIPNLYRERLYIIEIPQPTIMVSINERLSSFKKNNVALPSEKKIRKLKKMN